MVLSRFEKKHLKQKHIGKSHGNRFFPSVFFTPKTLSAARLNLSKWSSYDVPKARGLHLHSLGRKLWWTQDGSVWWGANFTWGLSLGSNQKSHIFFRDVVIILTPLIRNRLQTQRPILDVWGKMGIIIKSGTAFFVMNPMESVKNHQRKQFQDNNSCK